MVKIIENIRLYRLYLLVINPNKLSYEAFKLKYFGDWIIVIYDMEGAPTGQDPELDTDIVRDSFQKAKKCDVVLGVRRIKAGEKNSYPVTIPLKRSYSKVWPYIEGEDLTGRLMCYRCYHSFPAPKGVLMAQDVKCPNCKAVDAYYQHKCAPTDPNRHSAGWPYDDPTIPCDC